MTNHPQVLLWKLSTRSGAAGHTQEQRSPAESLGKYISTTELQDGVLNGLFDVISAAENEGRATEYRCLFLHNNLSLITLPSIVLWLSDQVSGGADFAIGIDPTAASAIGTKGAQAVEVPDRKVGPVGVRFSSPTKKEHGLMTGDIKPGECKAVWFRRRATDSLTMPEDGLTVNLEGEGITTPIN